jgi:hypothetical protein
MAAYRSQCSVDYQRPKCKRTRNYKATQNYRTYRQDEVLCLRPCFFNDILTKSKRVFCKFTYMTVPDRAKYSRSLAGQALQASLCTSCQQEPLYLERFYYNKGFSLDGAFENYRKFWDRCDIEYRNGRTVIDDGETAVLYQMRHFCSDDHAVGRKHDFQSRRMVLVKSPSNLEWKIEEVVAAQ